MQIPSSIKFLLITSTALNLAGCKTVDRLSQVGETPPLTRIQNPVADASYQPVTMPMPAPQIQEKRINSLWQTGARAFFKDQRANRVGDILTVNIQIADKADISNATTRNRQSSLKGGVDNFLGLEGNLSKFLPEGVNPSKLVGITSNPTHQGTGAVNRKETINLTVAAAITQILPNGNFVISGRQEVRVNYEIRELILTGIVRPEDISSANAITLDKIAEARISYGGRGQLDDVQQAPYGQQIIDAISPM